MLTVEDFSNYQNISQQIAVQIINKSMKTYETFQLINKNIWEIY